MEVGRVQGRGQFGKQILANVPEFPDERLSFSLQLGLGGTALAFTIGAIAFLRKPRA